MVWEAWGGTAEERTGLGVGALFQAPVTTVLSEQEHRVLVYDVGDHQLPAGTVGDGTYNIAS